jgi:hypothetical protein
MMISLKRTLLSPACPLREDDAWRVSQEVAGPANQDIIEPEKREVRRATSRSLCSTLVWLADMCLAHFANLVTSLKYLQNAL